MPNKSPENRRAKIRARLSSNVMHWNEIMKKLFQTPLIISLLVLCNPLNAQANAILPYMAVPYGQAFLLPIVVLIESLILRRLAGRHLLIVLFQVFIANCVSTAIGAAIYFPFLESPLFRWWEEAEIDSMPIISAIIALVFALILYIISWSTESIVIARMRKIKITDITGPCARANLATYILLLGLALILVRLEHLSK